MNTLPTTQRGFVRLEFSDASAVACSLQESSNAMQSCVWLGCNDANPMVLEPGRGWQPVPMPKDYLANTRMQLNQQMVSWLLPYLQHFAATGRLEQAEGLRPMGYMPFGIGDQGQDVPLFDYAGFTEDEVQRKVMHKARLQGFKGDVAERLKGLNWQIRPIFA
jgi:hypothetical protein